MRRPRTPRRGAIAPTRSVPGPIRPGRSRTRRSGLRSRPGWTRAPPTGRRALLRYAARPARAGRHAGGGAGVSDGGLRRRRRFDGRGGRGAAVRAGTVPTDGRFRPYWSAMIRRSCWLLVLGAAACGGSTPEPRATPTPVSRVSEGASSGEIDSLWARAKTAVRHGKWGDALKHLDRRPARVPAGRPARAAGTHVRGRGAVRHGQPPPGRARVPEGRPTTRRTIRWPPRRCFGSVTSMPTSGAGPSWIRRTARRRSPPTRSCSTATRAPRRPSARRSGSMTCRSASPRRNTRRRCTTCVSRPSTRRSCTSRTWSRPTRGAPWPGRADPSGPGVPDARLQGGRAGDLRIHPPVPRQGAGCGEGVPGQRQPGRRDRMRIASASSAARSIPSITAI